MEEIAACAGHAEGGDLLLLNEGYEASVHAQESVGNLLMSMEEIAACAGHAEGGDLPLFDEGYEASVYAQESVGKTEDVTEEI